MWERFSAALGAHRRRIAGAVLVVFVLVIALDLSRTVPRETHLAFDLGEDHAAVRSIEVAYTCGDEAVGQARHRTPSGAPGRWTDTIDLVPGHYSVRVDLAYANGSVASHEGEFDAPAEGVVVVQWSD